jgi:hypothetical protein
MSLDFFSPRLAEFLSESASSTHIATYSGTPTVALQPPKTRPFSIPESNSIPDRESGDRRPQDTSSIPAFIDPEVWNAAIRPMDQTGDWGERADTEFLLNLYRATGGRWIVVHDRWCARYGTRARTMEQLKSRFVKVIAKMIDLKLCTSGNGNFRYSELYDTQRRNFLERTWKRDSAVLEQTARIVKDLFKKNKKAPVSGPVASGPSSGVRVGVSLASQLAKSPEVSAELAERLRFICNSLGVDKVENRGFLRSLRIQKAAAAVNKLIHSVLIVKEVIAAKKPGANVVLGISSAAGPAGNAAAVYASSPQVPNGGTTSTAAPGAVRVRVQPGGVSAAATQSRATKKRKTDEA